MTPFHPFVARPVHSLLACLFLLALLTASAGPVVAHNESGHADSVLWASPLAAPVPVQITGIVTSTGLPNVILITLTAAGQTLLPQYSLDAGRTWQEIYSLPGCGINPVLAPRGVPNPQDNVRILVEHCNLTDLYRTGDYGKTWALAAHVYDIISYLVASPVDPKRLYFGVIAALPFPPGGSVSGVWTSGDAGVNWQGAGGHFDPVYPSPILAQRVYVGFGDWSMSDDAGQHWTPKNFPVYDLALDGQDPAWLYGLGRGSSYRLSGRSSDGGSTWIPWLNPPCETGQLMAHPTKTHVLFLRCASGLYRSTDAGDHWSQLSSTSGSLLAPDYGVPGRILWARSDGLWASTDDGDHWQLLRLPFSELLQSYLPLVQR